MKKKATASNFNKQSRASGLNVVDYAVASPELKAGMERVMEAIDRNPDSFEAVVSYGHPPLDTLGKVANGLIAIQTKFNQQVKAVEQALKTLDGGLKGLHLDTFGEAVVKALKGQAGPATTKVIEDMVAALPKMLTDINGLVDNVDKTDKNILDVLKELKTLGDTRKDTARELALLLGASREVLRRYDEEYIPEARKQFAETNDAEDSQYLSDVLKRKEDFIDRITVLEGSRASGIILSRQIAQVAETLEDQHKKLQDILYNSANEWKAMIAAAGIAGTSTQQASARREQFAAAAASDGRKKAPAKKKKPSNRKKKTHKHQEPKR